MPYLVFALGLIIGLFALTYFFMQAKPADIKLFARNALIGAYILIMLFFAFSGRIAIFIAVLVFAIIVVIAYYKKKNSKAE